MRIPIHPVRGKARQREDTAEDRLSDELSKTYTVLRQKALDYVDESGHKQTMVMDMAIPDRKLIIEIQGKQDNKSIMAEMAREKVARENGWRICRLTEREAMGDNMLALVKREIDRQ
jgi:very-short-patch-repair endonuclease